MAPKNSAARKSGAARTARSETVSVTTTTDALKAAVGNTLAKGAQKADQAPPVSAGLTGPANDETQAPKGLSEAGVAKVKAMLKDGKVTPVLTKADQEFTQEVVNRAYDEVVKKGGYFDLKEKLDASKATLTSYVYEFAMRAERAHDAKTAQATAVRSAYYDALVDDAQKKAQLAERKTRPERDAEGKLNDRQSVVPVKELLGDHWVVTVSKFRASLMKGFLPSDFLNGTAFTKAGKEARKPGGSQNQTTSRETQAATAAGASESVGNLAKAAGFGELTSAALQKLVAAVKAVDIDADVQAAVILTKCTQELVALAAGTYVPEAQDEDVGSKAAASA